ncbi:MAG: hypothetical protein H7X88_11105, partial [Gloeobacteraceae cyanobacterium ES-bin-316]|nr:hypothetical protein [Ferruginibacter sp.]
MQKIMKTVTIYLLLPLLLLQSCEKSSESVSAAAAAGANGSLTRFITYNNFLYIVDNTSLKSFDISTATPVLKRTTSVGFSIETIFEYQGKLFIGSNNAIFIYGLTNPEQPAFLSQFNYFIPGRDPVVAIDSVAYSTTRNFNGPGGNLNIVNIKNLSAPVFSGSIGLESPYGLAVNGNALYVCNGSNGISIFDRTNAYSPVLSQQFNMAGETFYDLILRGNMMICYIKSGIVILD